MPAIRLIAGLGNPGPQYEHTPHNAGVWFVEMLCRRFAIPLALEPKFKGRIGRGMIGAHEVRLVIPNTFMNLSGESIAAVAAFYKFAPAEIFVAHDEMAFPIGTVRLKTGGGHNGHNGVRDIIRSLGNDASFVRLRIGVGHPGDRDRVTGFLTSARMPAGDREAVLRSIDLPTPLIESIVAGDLLNAMNVLHAVPPGAKGDG